MNVKLRFGSRPKAISPGGDRAIQTVVQSVQSFGKARTPSQVQKSGARLTWRWMGLGFQLIGQGIGKRFSSCFKG